MRLMFLGDRIYGGHSAYSKVGYETCTRLAKMGHHVAHTPIGRANKMSKQVMDGVLIQLSGDDYFSEDVVLSNYTEFNADMLITVKDLWTFNNVMKLPVNFAPLVPIEHSPVSDAITYRLTHAYKPIVNSRHGQAELRRNRIDSTYIPHGVRTDVFEPLTAEEKVKAREIFGLPQDAYVVLIVAMNRNRKMIPRMLRGFKRFRELNPDANPHCMLWTNIQPRRPHEHIMGVSDVGVNLVPEIMLLGINEVVHWANWNDVERMGGLPDRDLSGKWDMRQLYGSADVNFLCSGGESAGLPYLEAGSMAVPSIGTNYAGAPEYVGAGLTVAWHDYAIFNTPGARYALPDIDGMAEALAKVYNTDREKLGRKCRRFAESYDWDVIMDMYWAPFLEECERELYPLITKEGTKTWAS